MDFQPIIFIQFLFCTKTPWNSFWAWILIIFTILAHLTSWNGQIWHFLSILVIFGDFCSRQFLGGIVVPKSQFLDCIWKFRFRPTSGYPWFIRGGRTYPLKMASKKFWFSTMEFLGIFASISLLIITKPVKNDILHTVRVRLLCRFIEDSQ